MIFGQKIINILACLSKVKKNWVQFWQFSQKANLALQKRAAHEGNVTMKQLQREVLINTKGQYMKVLNILAGNVTMKQLQREILLKTKGQYMKESNTIVGNAANNFLRRKILRNIKG